MTNEWPPPPGTPPHNTPPGGQPGGWNQPVPPGQPGQPGQDAPRNWQPNGPGYQSGPTPAQGQWHPGQPGQNPTTPIGPGGGQYGPPPGTPYGVPPQPGPPQPGPPHGPPQPGQGWGPGGYPPGNGPVPLGQYGQPPPRKRGSKLPLMIALVLIVVLGAAGTTYALVSGDDEGEPGSPSSATAAAMHLPDTSLAALTLDLDPSNAEKVAMLNFLRTFPALDVGSGTDSIVSDFLEPLIGELGGEEISQDILPWLGSKAAVAAIPGEDGGEPIPVAAVQVTSQDRARQGLNDIAQQSGDEFGFTFADGYVILSDTNDHSAAASSAAAGSPLGDNSGYRDDIDAVAENAVLTMWGDLTALSELDATQGGGSGNAQNLSGHVAGALSFEAHVAELRFAVTGSDLAAQSDADPIGPEITALPDDTILAIGSSGVSDADEFADGFETGFTAALDARGLGDELGDADELFETIDQISTLIGNRSIMAGDPENLGIVTTGDDPDESAEAATTALNAFGVENPQVSSDGDEVAVATTSEYADTIRSGGGSLGESDLFRQAVPDAANANLMVYASLESILPTDHIDENAAVLRAVGLTASDTEAVIRLVV